MSRNRMDEWDEVEQRFAALTEHLKRRFADVGAEAETERQALEQSVQGLIRVVEEALAATEQAMRDRRLRTDVAEVFASLRHALTASIDVVQRRMLQPAGVAGHASAPSTAPATKPPAAKRAAPQTGSRRTAARPSGQRVRHAG